MIEPAPAPARPQPGAASAVLAAESAQPTTRRSRRAQRAEQPAVAVPAIASVAPAEPERMAPAFEAELPTRDEPAPLLDTVLAPAEPFELLEPAVAEEAAAAPSEATPDDEQAEGAASSGTGAWIADTFAKILAAESVVAAAATATEVDVRPAEQAADRVEAEPAASRERQERPRTERIEPLTGPIPQPAASGVDEFEAAARLFSFTGETPVQEGVGEAEAAAEAEPEAETEGATHAAPRRAHARRGASFKRVATASFSIGVFGIVGLMAVGMTTPAEAVAAANGTDAPLSLVAAGHSAPVIDEAEIQAYVAPGDAQNDTLQRTENYTTTTTAQLASEAGIQNFSNLFHNNPSSNIQWPFAVGVTMSYGFGMRSGRMHEGIDFTPGNGAPVQAIADGTVRVASEAGGPYGVHVIIDHIVDGELVSSHYAHMQYGSLQVTPGQHVTVGTVIGRTGNTGRSYGAHTHFEILQNGTTAIDPWPWLQQHTDGTHTVG
ncbi:M23 family metallopeptidase [Microbacterium sp. E-13]|uniref:M23 family metallopeptidase n=1 Tax=Microbacterium sp. E-13 TaxID=3404048 RepID=UPI003CEA862E